MLVGRLVGLVVWWRRIAVIYGGGAPITNGIIYLFIYLLVDWIGERSRRRKATYTVLILVLEYVRTRVCMYVRLYEYSIYVPKRKTKTCPE